jgi:hypothetical protein
VFAGKYFAESFFVGFFEENPGIGFTIEAPYTPGFDLANLNYILPGLFQYYGEVNKNCALIVEFLKLENFIVYPKDKRLGANVDVRISLKVKEQNQDGSD